MDHPVVSILDVVLLATRAQVAFSVEVTLKVTVRCRCHSVHTDVKLSALVEQWFLEVLLDYIGSLAAVHGCAVDDRLNLIQIAAHCNPAASVRVFTWLDDP